MMKLTETGQFLLGLPLAGKLHFDFEVQTLTMGGECRALEAIEALNLNLDNPSQRERRLIDMAYLAEQLNVAGMEKSALTPEFLLDNLATDDYLLVEEALVQLRKKRQAVMESQATTSKTASPTA